MKKLVSAVLSMALCLTPMTAALMNTSAAGEKGTAVSEETAGCSISFEDELVIKAGETKEFNYNYYGTDKIAFEELVYGTGLIISNEYENGKGVLTVTAREWASDVHKFWCYLGDNVKDENGNLHREGSYLVVLEVLFHCPDCGRYVKEDEVAHGPMRSICKYCYDNGGYVGTTTGTSTIITTTTIETTTPPTTADTELPNPNGYCGEDLTWEIKDGVLTISGTGDMYPYFWQSPFSGDEYEEVVISDGITSIGANAFAAVGLPLEPPSRLARVSIPDSVTSIGDWAFYDCTELKEISIPESVTEMGEDVFGGCPDLTIKGVAGSYAETYANENNIPFEAISGATESTTTTTAVTTTAIEATATDITVEDTDGPKHIASDETLLQWVVYDYQEKKGTQNVAAKIVSSADDKYVIDIMDDNGSVLDSYMIDPVSGTGTNSDNETVDLPQTGMSGVHKTIAGMAALVALTGAVLIKKSKNDDEE